MTATSDDLKTRFLEAVREERHWAYIWQLLADHPCYTAQLKYWADAVVRKQGAPLHWREDVEQEAMILLGRQLSRRRDLGIDLEKAERSFVSWIGTVTMRNCQQALRTVRNRYQEAVASGREEPMSLDADVDRRIDVAWAIDQLKEPERTAVILRGQQLTLEELGKAMNLGYWEARNAWLRGRKHLQFLLGNSYEDD